VVTRRDVSANSGSGRMRAPWDGALARVHLFGGLTCEWRGSPVELPHSLQRVVALLSLSPRPLARTEAAELLWPARDPEHASGSMRTSIWRLGLICPGLVVSDAGRLALQPQTYVDYRERSALAHQLLGDGDGAGRGLLHTTAAFVPGVSLLPGWYDDWVLFNRERIAGLRIQVLVRAATIFLDRGESARALDAALLALRAEPLNELTHMLVARIHLAQGNPSEAVRQYHLCAELMDRELGIRPSERFASLLPPARRAEATQERVAAGSITAST
jgi:DNA-binding SARP family transcriptional activator